MRWLRRARGEASDAAPAPAPEDPAPNAQPQPETAATQAKPVPPVAPRGSGGARAWQRAAHALREEMDGTEQMLRELQQQEERAQHAGKKDHVPSVPVAKRVLSPDDLESLGVKELKKLLRDAGVDC